jgi:hypothetical protein
MYGPTFDHPGGWSWRSSAYVYSPKTGEIRSSDTDDILLWMVDTDYDAESFVVRHCYFAGRDGKPDGLDPYKRLKTVLKADIDESAWATLYSTRSRPFAKPATGEDRSEGRQSLRRRSAEGLRSLIAAEGSNRRIGALCSP